MRLILLAISIILSAGLYAQSAEEQQAAYHYQNGEYDKAVVFYKALHAQNPQSQNIYENYLQCLLALGERKQAISVVKKQRKRQPAMVNYAVDLAYVYGQVGMVKERDELVNELIEAHRTQHRNVVHQLVQAFVRRDFQQAATRTFVEAIEVQGLDPYWNSLMNLYRMTGEDRKAIRLGLEAVKHNANNRYSVSFHFSRVLENSEDDQYLQTECLRYSQQYPDHAAFDELLMDVYMYRKRFDAAFRQARAMDLRSKGNGSRILNLAQTCLNNKAYEVARNCYTYLIQKGPNSLYYIDGRVGLLKSHYLELESNPYRSSEQVADVRAAYTDFIETYGFSAGTAPSVRELASLYLFYTKEVDSAAFLLSKIVELQHIDTHFKGECKLLLADAYLMKNEPWEARLYYGQVDKEFKEDPLGQEAKFRHARLAYFMGDFDWAVGQLDVLKTATTQLIANNALDLALLIQENTGLDTSYEAMTEYAHAEFLFFQHRYQEAMDVLDIIPSFFGGHSLTDEVLFLQAKIHAATGAYEQALEAYSQVYELHAFDILADNALFAAAELKQDVFNDPAGAFKLYEKIILEYDSSLFVVEARKRYDRLKAAPLP